MGDIGDFMASHAFFKEQEGSQGRRYFLISGDIKIAYLWFKWALGGWNAISFSDNSYTHIPTIEILNEFLMKHFKPE